MSLRQYITGTFAVLVALQLAACRELFQTDCEDDTCVEEFTKCGGTFFNVSVPCCDPAHSCVAKNYFYAQCLDQERAEINIASGWDGTVLDCEEMPEDVIGGPMDTRALRRLQQDPMGGYGGMDCEDDTCGEVYDKCGGGFNVSTPCCDPETSCVVKNWFYAQCLTEERAAENVELWGWDGRVLVCEEMPEDAPKGPVFWDFNKTVDDVEYEVNWRRLQQVMESDCEDDTCVETFEKCGGNDFNVSVPCCDATSMCVVKNYWYAQCLSAAKAEENIEKWGWDGRTLECEEMPEELKPMPEMASRRLLDVGSYGGYGSYGGKASSTYGDKGMPAGTYGAPAPSSYGDRSFELPSEAPAEEPAEEPTEPAQEPTEEPAEEPTEEPTEEPAEEPAEDDQTTIAVTPEIAPTVKESPLVLGEGCDVCAPIFGQCADKGAIVSCCGDGLQCTKKNGFYAQCLTPERSSRNIENFGWDGSVLTCGEMML